MWETLNSKAMFKLFPADVLAGFLMSKVKDNKQLYYELKKRFMDSFSAAMFYSF